MRQKSGPQVLTSEQIVKDIRRATRKHHAAEDKIRIVLEGLRGANTVLLSCADGRAWPKVCTIPGQRSSSKLANAG